MAQQKCATLNSGAKFPVIGLGTWKAPVNVTKEVVYEAIVAGYRHVDCAAVYQNEVEVGTGISKALKEGICSRKDLFITSKLWCSHHKPEHVQPACQRVLKDLGLDYLDLYLIHFPVSLEFVPFDSPGYPGDWGAKKGSTKMAAVNVPLSATWGAMEKLVEQNLVKHIGVSNFNCQLIADLLTYCKIKPAVNQVEMHPNLQQKNMMKFCKANGIVVTAYSPFGSKSYKDFGVVENSEPDILENEVLVSIGKAHNKSSAQVILRWFVQLENVTVAVKSKSKERIKFNIDVFDFDLSKEEMEKISRLDSHTRYNDPDKMFQVFFDIDGPVLFE